MREIDFEGEVSLKEGVENVYLNASRQLKANLSPLRKHNALPPHQTHGGIRKVVTHCLSHIFPLLSSEGDICIHGSLSTCREEPKSWLLPSQEIQKEILKYWLLRVSRIF